MGNCWDLQMLLNSEKDWSAELGEELSLEIKYILFIPYFKKGKETMGNIEGYKWESFQQRLVNEAE